MKQNYIWVTGGLGYIGSHVTVELARQGFQPVILDNCINSDPSVLQRISKITGTQPVFFHVDVRERSRLQEIATKWAPQAVIHFAALKCSPESVEKPLEYFDNNLGALTTTLDVATQSGCEQFVFSSSATVYGEPARNPIPESHPLAPSTPYGQTKQMGEDIVAAACHARPRFSAVNLRYFNPVGAHPSGGLGENPRGLPNNVMPYLCQVAAGLRPHLTIYGDDYPTRDGTGVRDYIHVMDLAEGHVAALSWLSKNKGLLTCNLGTGRGHSVRELVQAFEQINRVPVPNQIGPRRPGDVAICYADPSLAHTSLGWKATRSLEDMVRDAWAWQKHLGKQ